MDNAILFEDLDETGTALRDMAEECHDISVLLASDARSVMMAALGLTGAPTLGEGYALIVNHWNAVGEFAPNTQSRFAMVLAQATRRAEHLGITRWDGSLDPVVCESFIDSRAATDRPPSISTRHVRRSALRAGFTTLRWMGLVDDDPTRSIMLPALELGTRSATDDEIALLRMHSVARRESRQPLALAFSEATARTSEIPFITYRCLDCLDEPWKVSLPGTRQVKPRIGRLTPWGHRVVKRTIAQQRNVGFTMDDRILYGGDQSEGDVSPTASLCGSISQVMARAGLTAKPDLRPASIAYWAGRQAFEAAEDHKIEAAAYALGLRSLDRTAERIDYSWDAR